MTKYLLDTNVILRFANPSDEQHDLATEAVATLLEQSVGRMLSNSTSAN